MLSLARRLARLSPWTMAALLFAAGLIVRNAVALRLGFYAEPVNFGELELIGKSLAETGVFGNPYRVPTGPTAHGAPFFPYFMSLIFQLFGYGNPARVAVVLCGTVFTALSFSLLPPLAARTGIPAWTGGLAGLFGALLPFRAISELIWEAPYTATGWIAAVIVTIGWVRQPDWKRSLVCGLAWGALFWAAPQLLLVFLLILLTSRARSGAALAGAVALVVIFPWILRGHRELGGWFFVRDNLGLELAVGNFPGAAPDYNGNCQPPGEGFCGTRHPYTNTEEARKVAERGELNYHRGRLEEAIGFITADPAAFFKRTAQRVVMFWFTPSGGPLPVKDLILYPTTLLAFYGLWRMLRAVPEAGRVFACCLAGFPVPYYVVNIITRYQIPMSWLIFFLAAYGAVTLVGERKH